MKEKIKSDIASLFTINPSKDLVSKLEELVEGLKFEKAIATLRLIQLDTTAFIKNYEKKADKKWEEYSKFIESGKVVYIELSRVIRLYINILLLTINFWK